MSFTNFSPLTDLNNLNNTLNEYGVIPNVFSEEECDLVRKNVFDYLAENHGVHTVDDFKKINPIEGGILHNYGIALIKPILDMKTDERVENIFKHIWNNEEVTMSLDGINIGVPPKLFNKTRPQSPAGFHTDQSSFNTEKCCVQALINLEHTEDGDACLSVLKGSHNFHAAFFKHFDIDVPTDWFVLNYNHYECFKQIGC